MLSINKISVLLFLVVVKTFSLTKCTFKEEKTFYICN